MSNDSAKRNPLKSPKLNEKKRKLFFITPNRYASLFEEDKYSMSEVFSLPPVTKPLSAQELVTNDSIYPRNLRFHQQGTANFH